MTPRPILIIECDATLRADLAEQIALEGSFTAVGAESAAGATAKLSEADFRYDAILLDVGLSDADGRVFCARLRRDGNTMPIIMLTGTHAEQDAVRGLDAGAKGPWRNKCFKVVVDWARWCSSIHHGILAWMFIAASRASVTLMPFG